MQPRRLIDLNTKPGMREGWRDFWKDFGAVILLCLLFWVIVVLALLI